MAAFRWHEIANGGDILGVEQCSGSMFGRISKRIKPFAIGDQARVTASGTQNLTAWLRCNEGSEEWSKFSRANNIKAQEFFQIARDADPDWSHPLAGLAAAIRESALGGWRVSREDALG